MSSARYAAIRAAFELLSASQLPRLVRRFSASKGVILTLHRVLPEPPPVFAPNAILQVTPRFLRAAIERVRELGLDILSLDEALTRVADPASTRKFVVITFDDAYRDNREHALPVLRELGCPFMLYVPTALVDGVGEVWWQALEDLIRSLETMDLSAPAGVEHLMLKTVAEKQAGYDRLYSQMRKMPEPARVALIRELCTRHGLDLAAHCRALIMDWSELRVFSREPLCTIGAHTVHHYELAKLPETEARAEMEQSAAVIAAQLGRRPEHLSYPIGGLASAGPREFAMARELGFRSAVTTRPGGLYHRHQDELTALPRVSLNGLFQSRRYLDVFATGALFGR